MDFTLSDKVTIDYLLEAPEGEHFQFKEAKSSFGFDEAAKCCCVLANCGGVCLYSVFLTSDLEKWLEAMLLSNRKELDVH